VEHDHDLNLAYNEPWDWMMPARHVLGALLLEQREAVEAEAVYREDLKIYKNNLWSLHAGSPSSTEDATKDRRS
jgi:hypothetical protein